MAVLEISDPIKSTIEQMKYTGKNNEKYDATVALESASTSNSGSGIDLMGSRGSTGTIKYAYQSEIRLEVLMNQIFKIRLNTEYAVTLIRET